MHWSSFRDSVRSPLSSDLISPSPPSRSPEPRSPDFRLLGTGLFGSGRGANSLLRSTQEERLMEPMSTIDEETTMDRNGEENENDEEWEDMPEDFEVD